MNAEVFLLNEGEEVALKYFGQPDILTIDLSTDTLYTDARLYIEIKVDEVSTKCCSNASYNQNSKDQFHLFIQGCLQVVPL